MVCSQQLEIRQFHSGETHHICFDNYNMQQLDDHPNKLDRLQSALARLVNVLVNELNQNDKLPRSSFQIRTLLSSLSFSGLVSKR